MQESYEKEIRELQAFFEAWYRGTVDNSEVTFSRLADVLAPEFMLITSDGYILERERVLSLLRTDYAAKTEIELRVEDCQLRLASGDILLVTYEEHGTTQNLKKTALISAVLRKNPALPNGLEWLHIHEVNLPSQN
jgi:hypothetical protein